MQPPDRTPRPSSRRERTTTGHDDVSTGTGPTRSHRDRGESTTEGGSGRERIGNYVIGNEIGRGSFATVYKGYRSVSHTTLDQTSLTIRKDRRRKTRTDLFLVVHGSIAALETTYRDQGRLQVKAHGQVDGEPRGRDFDLEGDQSPAYRRVGRLYRE